MRKWTRTKKLLAVVLSAAMVLTLNTAAFATDESTGPKITIDPEDGHAIIEKADDPVSWNSATNGDELAAILNNLNDHLANDKKITVSDTSIGLSANVYPVDGADGYYLILGYHEILVQGEGYAFNGGTYDGRKVGFEGKGSTASKKGSMTAELALVKWDASAKTVTEINGVTVADLKVKGDAKNANVSLNAAWDKDYNYLGYPKTAELPTVTIKPAVKFAKGVEVDKAVKSGVKKTLKDKEFKLAIRRDKVHITNAWNVAGDKDTKVSDNDVAKMYYDQGIELCDSATGEALGISKANTKSGKVTLTRAFTVKGKIVEKALGNKEFTATKATVGGEDVIVIDSFDEKNYEYQLLEDKYKFAIREKGKKNYTGGIYASADDCYLDSVE